jgi:hypothetical protein
MYMLTAIAEAMELSAAMAAGAAQPQDLTAQDNEAIDNLMAIVPHMTRARVTEAYLQCDKNVEYTMNMLLSAFD